MSGRTSPGNDMWLLAGAVAYCGLGTSIHCPEPLFGCGETESDLDYGTTSSYSQSVIITGFQIAKQLTLSPFGVFIC